MNPYEMTFIVRPDRDEEQTRAAVETVTGRITSAGGELIAAIPWNPPRRRMAYPIREFGDGFYVTTVFRLDSTALRAIENALKLNDNILRFLIVQATDQNIKQAQQRLQQQQAAAAAPPPQPEAVGARSQDSGQEVPQAGPSPVEQAPTAPSDVAAEPVVGTEPADAASDIEQLSQAETVPAGSASEPVQSAAGTPTESQE